MKLEKSCGAVIFAESGGERLYLLEHMQKGHTSLCKGHVEGAETEHETAVREIREETALEVAFLDGFSRTIRYSPCEGCLKDVIFFLARAESMEVTAQPEEVASIEWVPLADALVKLTHLSDRETLLAADRFLNAHPEHTAFRPMRRHDRELTREQCEKLLKDGFDGVLSLYGDGGWPYGVPLSYVYRDGKIFFHGAKSGHKLDALRRENRASFCVVTQDYVIPQQYTTNYRSVIAFGLLREVTDEAEKREALRALALEYAPADTVENREKYIDADINAACVIELTVTRLSGKARTKL